MKTTEQCVDDCELTMAHGLFSRDNADLEVGDLRRCVLTGCFARCQADARAKPLEVLRDVRRELRRLADLAPPSWEGGTGLFVNVDLLGRIDALLAGAPSPDPQPTEDTDTRPFPIMGETVTEPRPIRRLKPSKIPWWLAEVAYEFYHSRHPSQSLERLAERGGFGRQELVAYLRREFPGKPQPTAEQVAEAMREYIATETESLVDGTGLVFPNRPRFANCIRGMPLAHILEQLGVSI